MDWACASVAWTHMRDCWPVLAEPAVAQGLRPAPMVRNKNYPALERWQEDPRRIETQEGKKHAETTESTNSIGYN